MDALSPPPPPPGTRLDTLRSLPHVVRGWEWWYARTIAWNALTQVAGSLAAGAAAYAVAASVTQQAPDLRVPIVLVLTATVLRSIAVWREAYTSHDLAFRLLARMRTWVFGALARIAPAGIAGRRTGDLASTTMGDSEQLEIFYAHSSLYAVGRYLITPVLLAGLAVINLPIALITVPFLVAAWMVPLAARRSSVSQGRVQRAVLAGMGADMNENVGAVREISAFGLTRRRLDRLEEQQDQLLRSQRRTITRVGLESAVSGVIGGAIAVAATAVGVGQVQSGALALEWLPVAVAIAGTTPAAIAQWAAMTRHQGNLAASARRIEQVLEAPDPLPVRGQPLPCPRLTGCAAEVTVSGVTYTWPGGHQPAVRGVDLHIPAGQTVALAGRSGAGKSTLAQLIARWYDPDTGQVAIAGTPLDRLERSALPDLVALVPQEPYLFAESVRANLTIATTGHRSDPDLWDALCKARADEVVARMPEGLDTVLADHGRNLSGGERQRLALARAFLTPTPVLILDEAVSQLDTDNEDAVRVAFTDTARTTIVIAHRLSTLLHAERILVLDRGAVVGDGTHPDLLIGCPAYADLVGPQLRSPLAELG